MINYIYSTTRFEKMLSAMKTSEKMAVSAAKKADEIIRNIRSNGDAPLSEVGKLTRHGEFRIKNCIKYDIGKGYRMVCVKDEDRLFLLFVGPHDACSAWVENNRNFVPDPDRKNVIITRVERNGDDDDSPDDPDGKEPDYDEVLFSKITDSDLKVVFNGLVNSVSCSV